MPGTTGSARAAAPMSGALQSGGVHQVGVHKVGVYQAAARFARAAVLLAAVAMRFAAVAALFAAAAAHAASATGARVPGIARTQDAKPDLTGIWQAISTADFDLEPHSTRKDAPPGAGVVEGDTIPYTPAALKQKQQNFAARDKLDPRLQCFTLGVPRDNYYPEPFQILQRPRDLTLIYEFGNSVRTIHTNGTLHPTGDNPEFWLGDSRGSWEGDTLVVDVTDFTDKTWLDRAGNFHSDALHVVERWTPLDKDHIEYRATIEDSKVFTRPWTLHVILYRLKDKNIQLIENYCYTLAYDKYYPFPSDAQPGAPQ